MMKVRLIIMAAVLLTGASFCLGDMAYLLGVGQDLFNVVYIAILMPVCVCGIIETLFKLR